MRELKRSKAGAFELREIAEQFVGGFSRAEEHQFTSLEGNVIQLNGPARIEHFATHESATHECVIIENDVLVFNQPAHVIHIPYLKIDSLHIGNLAQDTEAPTCQASDNA